MKLSERNKDTIKLGSSCVHSCELDSWCFESFIARTPYEVTDAEKTKHCAPCILRHLLKKMYDYKETRGRNELEREVTELGNDVSWAMQCRWNE